MNKKKFKKKKVILYNVSVFAERHSGHFGLVPYSFKLFLTIFAIIFSWCYVFGVNINIIRSITKSIIRSNIKNGISHKISPKVVSNPRVCCGNLKVHPMLNLQAIYPG